MNDLEIDHPPPSEDEVRQLVEGWLSHQRVGYRHRRGLTVSTVRLPDKEAELLLRRQGTPLYETMIFDDGAPRGWVWHRNPFETGRFTEHPLADWQCRYTSAAEAVAGHRYAVRLARVGAQYLAGPPPYTARQRPRGGRR